jgi:L-asparaginase II
MGSLMQQDIQIFRGLRIESAHELAICIANDSGETIFAHGDVAQKIYPRSAVKLMQAMPLVISGGAEAFSLNDKMLSLTCASHSGEPEHAALAAAMLAKAGLSEPDLMCGVHWPSKKSAAYALAGAHEKASQFHNNCSGKHAGFLLYAKHKGYPVKDYVASGHPVQRDIRVHLEEIMQEKLASNECAIDGCSIPSCMFSLKALARGFARLGTGKNLSEDQGAAATRLRQACAAEPFYTAGTGRFDTRIIELFGARAYVKTGAEGVYGGILPGLKLGFALKCLDGGTRAAECMTANIIAALLPMSEDERQQLAPLCAPVLTNWRGVEVGKVQINKELEARLAQLKP